MLAIQDAPFQHETAYALDCMVDEMYLDQSSAMVLQLFGDRSHIDGIVAKPPRPAEAALTNEHLDYLRESNRRVRGGAGALADYATEIIRELEPEKQGAVASMMLTHCNFIIHSTAKFMAGWSVGDMAEGGYGEAYNRPPKVQYGTALPNKKNWRRANAPAWIRRYVKRETECHRLRALTSRIVPRLAGLDPALIKGDPQAFDAALKESKRRREEHEVRQWDEMRAQQPDFVVTLKRKAIGEHRRRRHLYRKVLRRGMATAAGIVGQQKTEAFVKGQSVLLEGINLDLIVVKQDRAAGMGHGQIALSARTKAGEALGSLCFYIEDTPAIDQLTAVALHLAAGEEAEIIEAANLITVAPAAIEHPLFAKKGETRAVRTVLNDVATPYVPGLHSYLHPTYSDLVAERDELYWKNTGHIWLEATGVFLLGAKAHKLMLQSARKAA